MKKLIYSMLFIMALYSCIYKDRCEKSVVVYVPQKMNDYFSFWKLGSYWVFENEDKTIRDSVFVIDYKRDTTGCGLTGEEIDIETTSINRSKLQTRLNIRINSVYMTVPTLGTIDLILNDDNSFVAYEKEISHLTELNLNGHDYKGEILKIKSLNPSYDYTFFFQKDVGIVGLISKDYYDSRKIDTLSLIKYNLKQ